MHRKPTFTRQYLNFNSHHPQNVKKGIIRCLKHRVKAISNEIDAHQEEMISLRHNLHHNIYPESIISAPRNLDWRIEDGYRKITTVCLPYVKSLAKRIKRYIVHISSEQYSQVDSLEVSLLCQDANKIQHGQELCVLDPL